MRLEDQKKSDKLVDNTWISNYVDWKGDVIRTPAPNNFLQNEQGWLFPHEVKMIKSGASFKDILFLRALQNQQRSVLDRR